MKKLFVFIVCIIFVLGCESVVVDYTKTTKTDGTIVENTVTTTEGSIWQNKVVAGSGSVQALKLETTGGGTTGTFLPNVIIGGANNAIVGSPVKDDRPIMAYSKSVSLFGSMTSASASGISYVYIGTQGETSAQTVQRVKALKSLNDTINVDSTVSE